jgi:anhydro-N-acetylmuramic acid kinase
LSAVAAVSEALAEVAADIVSTLATHTDADQGPLLAVGLHGFGAWVDEASFGRQYHACCDTARLAVLTGLTVIDDFPSHDLACQGRGGPCEAAGIWLLIADQGAVPGRRIRALVELDETLRLMLLPPRQTDQLPAQLLAYDLAPCRQLLDQLGQALTSNKQALDPHGKLAVQGKHVPALLDRWCAAAAGQTREWRPSGCSPASLLQTLSEEGPHRSASVYDLLCTAVHFLAERVARHVKHHLPRSQPVGQLLLSGPGRHHGFLVREIQQRLPEVEISAVDTWGVPDPYLPSAATALLAALHVDQVPANSLHLTGTERPRVLGRITPGSPANWHDVLAHMAVTLPEKRLLRNAI